MDLESLGVIVKQQRSINGSLTRHPGDLKVTQKELQKLRKLLAKFFVYKGFEAMEELAADTSTSVDDMAVNMFSNTAPLLESVMAVKMKEVIK